MNPCQLEKLAGIPRFWGRCIKNSLSFFLFFPTSLVKLRLQVLMIYGLISLFPLFYKLNARLLKILHGFTYFFQKLFDFRSKTATKFKNVLHFIYNLTIFRTFFNNTYEISYNLWKKIDLLFVQTITSIVCDKRGVILRPTCINTLFVLFRSFVGPNPLPLVG